MPGRQAHGRSLTANPKANPGKKSKARSQKNALDAFGTAQERFPTQEKRTPRARGLEAEIERKHGRDDEGDDDEEEEDESPQKKRTKGPSRATDNTEYGSDSEGNEWQLGGIADDDQDSEIESEDAFGDSDEEKFQGYSFRGSKSKKNKSDDSEDDEFDAEGETLGEDAIDLATALDQYESDDEDLEAEGKSESSDDEDDDSDESDDSGSNDDDEDGDEADPQQLEALHGLISGFGGQVDDDTDKPTPRRKIGLSDLALSGISDPFIKKSMKLINKEEKENRVGASKKLAVPLARREQDRLDRTAAYDKTNQTLDRWTETVKHNRRAEHLVFPLPQNSSTAGLDRTEIQPLTAKNSSNELESTIMSIMEQSGLSMEKPQKPKEPVLDEEGNELTRKEIMNRKRLERELQSREAKRAKRINKIKSKAYHRVHRRQRERDEMVTKEAMEEAGEVDSGEEREAQDRRRALERVGQRHKESKWAKIGSKAKRAVWDDDFRSGLTEMARKDEELRRRKEGKTTGSGDEESDSGTSAGGDDQLRRLLDNQDEGDDEPLSKLMSMKFMQKAEAAKKKENDDLVKQIRRYLWSDEETEDSESEDGGETGRRHYGTADGKASAPALDASKRAARRNHEEDGEDAAIYTSKLSKGTQSTANGEVAVAASSTVTSTGGAWSRGEVRRKKKGTINAKIDDLDLNANVLIGSRPSKPKPSKATLQDQTQDGEPESETDQHLPLAIRDQELVARAFAGEDVVGEFERERAAIAEADDDKVVDNTLPGWGSWVGDGVSAREQKRHQGRFLTKVEGIKKKDRKDAKLERVIINEKRIKKNGRYLATQLPYPFESREQYERSLRLPVGPEWMTKETFQDSTKPRVLMKQGVITPISKPII